MKLNKRNPKNFTDKPYDNGAIGVIASMATIGFAAGAAIGISAEIPGLIIGAAIGAAVGVVSGLIIAEEMAHPTPIQAYK